jgi:peptide/nickel transport system substrate-binding protein
MNSRRRRPHSAMWRLAAAAAAAVAAGGLLAGCGGSSSSGAASSSGGGQTFVAAVQAIPTNLDSVTFSGGTRPFFTLLGSQLFNYADTACSVAPSTSALVGQLAKSWQLDPGGKSYTITLNDYKSQYGHPLTSEDVQWSLERGLALSPIVKFLSANSADYNLKNPITIVSPTVFKLNVEHITPVDLAMFTIPTYSIFDATEAKLHATSSDPWATKWIATHSDGFGPWQVQSFVPNNEIVFTQNPGYTGSRGNVSTMIMKQVPDPSDQAELLQSGSINYAGSLTWAQYKSLQSNPKVKVYSCAPTSRDWLLLNQAYGPLANVQVRQAINEAINRQALVTGAYAGYGSPALSPFLSSELPAGVSAPSVTESATSAKALMAQAGYPHGFSLTLTYNAVQPGSQVAQDAILLQSQLAQIGITLNLNLLASGNDLQSDQSAGKYQAMLWSESGAVPGLYFDAGLIEPGAPNNTWNYKSPAWIAATNELASQVGSPAYDAAATKLANLVVTDVPIVSLVNTPNVFAVTSNVSNVNASLRTAIIIPDVSELMINS